eukprot:TRINITY_DN7691_c0_g1_i2.p1 TRINITY_DN7691_c0_g1~~TRINITY_DN7691_c0_g1_i2.p1  ORF type:complete len:706 (-),score=175.35 TRINITY_DN7691_c0_g1_i2:950-3067(-)
MGCTASDTSDTKPFTLSYRDPHLPSLPPVSTITYDGVFREHSVKASTTEELLKPFGHCGLDRFGNLFVGVEVASTFDRKPRDTSVRLDLVLLIDVSSSMDENLKKGYCLSKIAAAKLFVVQLIRRLERDDTVSVVIFESNAERLLEPTSIKDSALEKVTEAVKSLQTRGNTIISSGLTEASKVALQAIQKRRMGDLTTITTSMNTAAATTTPIITTASRTHPVSAGSVPIVTRIPLTSISTTVQSVTPPFSPPSSPRSPTANPRVYSRPVSPRDRTHSHVRGHNDTRRDVTSPQRNTRSHSIFSTSPATTTTATITLPSATTTTISIPTVAPATTDPGSVTITANSNQTAATSTITNTVMNETADATATGVVNRDWCRVVLLTDMTELEVRTSRSVIQELSLRMATEGIQLTYVGIGEDFDLDLVHEITIAEGSNYFCVLEENDFEKKITSQIPSTFFPLAREMELLLVTKFFSVGRIFGWGKAGKQKKEVMEDPVGWTLMNQIFDEKPLVLLKKNSVFPNPKFSEGTLAGGGSGGSGGDENEGSSRCDCDGSGDDGGSSGIGNGGNWVLFEIENGKSKEMIPQDALILVALNYTGQDDKIKTVTVDIDVSEFYLRGSSENSSEYFSSEGMEKMMILKQYVDMVRSVIQDPTCTDFPSEFLEWFRCKVSKFGLETELRNITELRKVLERRGTNEAVVSTQSTGKK